jgi:hypothetical protein
LQVLRQKDQETFQVRIIISTFDSFRLG